MITQKEVVKMIGLLSKSFYQRIRKPTALFGSINHCWVSEKEMGVPSTLWVIGSHAAGYNENVVIKGYVRLYQLHYILSPQKNILLPYEIKFTQTYKQIQYSSQAKIIQRQQNSLDLFYFSRNCLCLFNGYIFYFLLYSYSTCF